MKVSCVVEISAYSDILDIIQIVMKDWAGFENIRTTYSAIQVVFPDSACVDSCFPSDIGFFKKE